MYLEKLRGRVVLQDGFLVQAFSPDYSNLFTVAAVDIHLIPLVFLRSESSPPFSMSKIAVVWKKIYANNFLALEGGMKKVDLELGFSRGRWGRIKQILCLLVGLSYVLVLEKTESERKVHEKLSSFRPDSSTTLLSLSPRVFSVRFTLFYGFLSFGISLPSR